MRRQSNFGGPYPDGVTTVSQPRYRATNPACDLVDDPLRPPHESEAADLEGWAVPISLDVVRIGAGCGIRTRALAPALLALSIAGYLIVHHLAHHSSGDLIVYRGEGAAVRSGRDLFGTLYGPAGSATYAATYPPFAALLFVPLSYPPVAALVALGVAANVCLLTIVVRLAFRLADTPSLDLSTLCAAVALLIWAEPVFTTLRFGQIDLLLLALVLWDFARATGTRAHGIGVGLAAGIKVTPLIFIGYLLLTRRLRAAVTGAVTFVATLAVSGLVLPQATDEFWTRDLFDLRRVGPLEQADNQSLRGLLVRMDHTRHTAPGELLLIVVVAVAGLACAAVAYRRFGDAWGLPACAVTGLLVSPISWTHHWVWCVPIAIATWQHERRWLPAVLIFWTHAVWAVPHHDGVELGFTPLQIGLSSWYVLFGLGFLILLGRSTLVGRASRSPERDDQTAVSLC